MHEEFDPMAVTGVPPQAVKAAAKKISRKVAESKQDAAPQPDAIAPSEAGSDRAHAVASNQLRAYVERIERLEEEKATIADDIKDVYAEAKGTGFDAKILRKVVALRKRDPAERAEEDMILDTYLAALGMLETPQ